MCNRGIFYVGYERGMWTLNIFVREKEEPTTRRGELTASKYLCIRNFCAPCSFIQQYTVYLFILYDEQKFQLRRNFNSKSIFYDLRGSPFTWKACEVLLHLLSHMNNIVPVCISKNAPVAFHGGKHHLILHILRLCFIFLKTYLCVHTAQDKSIKGGGGGRGR